jgi:hypothetical protein
LVVEAEAGSGGEAGEELQRSHNHDFTPRSTLATAAFIASDCTAGFGFAFVGGRWVFASRATFGGIAA